MLRSGETYVSSVELEIQIAEVDVDSRRTTHDLINIFYSQ